MTVAEERMILQVSERCVEAEIAESFYEKLKGLRFRECGEMFFDLESPTRAVVDTLFVRGDLHLYFLNEDMEVVETECLPPNRFYTPSTEYRYLLESFEDLGVKEGDEVEKIGEVTYHRLRCGTLDYR